MSLPQLKLAHHMTALALEQSGICTLVIRYRGGSIGQPWQLRSYRISQLCQVLREKPDEGKVIVRGHTRTGFSGLSEGPQRANERIDPDATTHPPHPFTSFLLFLSWPPLLDFAPVFL